MPGPARRVMPVTVTASPCVLRSHGLQVRRTEKGKQLPIYTDYRHGRTKQFTILRRIDGDMKVCAGLVGCCLAPSPPTLGCAGCCHGDEQGVRRRAGSGEVRAFGGRGRLSSAVEAVAAGPWVLADLPHPPCAHVVVHAWEQQRRRFLPLLPV